MLIHAASLLFKAMHIVHFLSMRKSYIKILKHKNTSIFRHIYPVLIGNLTLRSKQKVP